MIIETVELGIGSWLQGTVTRVSLHREQLHVKFKGRVPWNVWWGTLSSIGQLGRACEGAASTYSHSFHAGIPASDDSTDTESKREPLGPALVKHFTVGKSTHVFHSHLRNSTPVSTLCAWGSERSVHSVGVSPCGPVWVFSRDPPRGPQCAGPQQESTPGRG